MPTPVSIPRLGWNMEVGVFVEWLKADGAPVKAGDALFRLEGEKATEEVESLDAGTLYIPANGPKTGDKIAVGTAIGYLLQPGEAAPPSGVELQQEAHAPAAPQDPSPLPAPHEPSAPQAARATITPRARRLAARLGVDVSNVRGSGRNGRVRERDIAALASPGPRPQPNALTATRTAIAARMMESRQTTAAVTLTSVIDATNLVNVRRQFRAGPSAVVPSFTDFLVRFASVALQQHPLLASRWTATGIVPATGINIGIAVDTDAGLLVPVLCDVPALGILELGTRTSKLIDRARRGVLSAREMQGGCFTITNLGSLGIDAFTPIINPPECAILGVGRIERRPVMDGDRVVGRELVTLSLTFDHRIVDGAPAARFLRTIASCIENPAPWVSS